MKALVMGATGNVGGELVAALLARDVTVRAVSRRERDWPAGVEGIQADVNAPDGLVGAAADVDAAYVMSGYPAEAGLLSALPPGAHVAVLSSSSAPLGDGGNAMGGYHLATERAVQASGRPWTTVRPCSMQSNLLRWREQLERGDLVTAPFGDVPTAMVDPADVAAVIALALTEPGHDGRVYRLSGPRPLTPGDQVAVLAAALGRELRFEAIPDDEARDQLAADYADAMFEIYREHPELESEVQDTIASVLGRPAGTLEAWISRHRVQLT